MNATHRLGAVLVSVLLLGVVTFGGPSQASALLLATNSTEPSFLGLVVSGEPSSETLEAGYINTLAGQAPSTSTTISGHTYDRSSNVLCYDTCPEAIVTGSVGSVGATGIDATGYQYLLAKYDGPNGGDTVWYLAGLYGVVDIPSNLSSADGCTTGGCGLSHWELFNPSAVPEPATLLLLGSGMVGIGFARRKGWLASRQGT